MGKNGQGEDFGKGRLSTGADGIPKIQVYPHQVRMGKSHMKLFKKIWNDPVWSKVIATIIILLGTTIWTAIKAHQNKIDFRTALANFWTYKVDIWIIFIAAVSVLAIYWFKKRFIEKIFHYDAETLELDRQIFDKIRNDLLPQNGSIYFLRNNNFAGFAFRINALDDLDKIEYENIKSDFEFFHPQLEQLKTELINKVRHFTTQIAGNTFSTKNGLQAVPPEWEIEQPKRFWEVVDDLSRTQREICDKYDELIRTGRRILKV